MKAILQYHYEDFDDLFPDDAKLGDYLPITAQLTVTQITEALAPEGRRGHSCQILLSNIKVIDST